MPFNSDKYKNDLMNLSTSALSSLAIDVRAQVMAGLMSNKEGHDRINAISVVLMRKQLAEQGISIEEDEDEDYEESLWREPSEGGQSMGDDLMTNGWED